VSAECNDFRGEPGFRIFLNTCNPPAAQMQGEVFTAQSKDLTLNRCSLDLLLPGVNPVFRSEWLVKLCWQTTADAQMSLPVAVDYSKSGALVGTSTLRAASGLGFGVTLQIFTGFGWWCTVKYLRICNPNGSGNDHSCQMLLRRHLYPGSSSNVQALNALLPSHFLTTWVRQQMRFLPDRSEDV